MSIDITFEAKLHPFHFDNDLIQMLRVNADKHFKQLGQDFEDTYKEVENLWLQELGTRRMKIPGRRGTGRPTAPHEHMKEMFGWEVGREGKSRWFFRFGAVTGDAGKEMRRMEYMRKVRYETAKEDSPSRRGRIPEAELETITVAKPLGIGPIRYAKHIHLETWEWEGGAGESQGKYKFQNMAPFRATCAQIIVESIKDVKL